MMIYCLSLTMKQMFIMGVEHHYLVRCGYLVAKILTFGRFLQKVLSGFASFN